jgi:uncharacterized protein with HEPN domain
MDKQQHIYIAHILECIRKIKVYTTGMTEVEFMDHPMAQDAVIRNFEVIGEATKKLDAEFREKHPLVQWRKVAGLRDKLIHGYMGVDLRALWLVVTDVLSDFEEQMQDIYDKMDKHD